ncbi:MAG: hypothetical protein ACYSSP_00985 [Planctomycetota bacterium]|jgi:hypothetical protein
MNRYQKGAWLTLGGLLIGIAASYFYIQLFIFKQPYEYVVFWVWLIIYCAWLCTVIIFALKKRSPTEVEKDERDSLIEKRAVIAAFVSVWILLFAESIIPHFIIGLDGSIPVWSLAPINVGIFMIATFVFTIAVLVQYGWSSKGEKT